MRLLLTVDQDFPGNCRMTIFHFGQYLFLLSSLMFAQHNPCLTCGQQFLAHSTLTTWLHCHFIYIFIIHEAATDSYP